MFSDDSVGSAEVIDTLKVN